jgi:hypothetical protein
MHTRRLLLVLLATLLLLGDGIAWRHVQPFPHPSAAVLVGLLLAQLGLVASWAACGRRSWLVRTAVTWTCAALIAWPLSQCTGPSWRAWASLLLIYSAAIVIAWKLLLAAGYRWTIGAIAPQASSLRAHQCSLAWILRSLTTCSLALGIGSWLSLPLHDPWTAIVTLAILALCLPMTLSLWLMPTQRWWLRGAAIFMLPLVGALFIALHRGPAAMFIVLCLGVQMFVALLAAMVLENADLALVVATESTASDAPPAPLRLAGGL